MSASLVGSEMCIRDRQNHISARGGLANRPPRARPYLWHRRACCTCVSVQTFRCRSQLRPPAPGAHACA
eukprot:12209888-Alexandrium_andersonii.AAC.1